MPLTLETLRDALGWCALINYAVLLVWWAVFALAGDAVRALHQRALGLTHAPLPASVFNSAHYCGMGLFKLGIFLFNLAPFIALHIVT